MIINNRFVVEVSSEDIRIVKIFSISELHKAINKCFKSGYSIYSVKGLEHLNKEELKNYFKYHRRLGNFKKLI